MTKKKIKITFNSPVVLCFAAVSLIAMICNLLTRGAANSLVFSVRRASFADPLTYVRFFTHVLGHSGWPHYIGNMSYLLLLGPALEEKYGSKKILGVIAVTAAVTGLVHFILFPGSALCGASGVVFAFILLTSFAGFREGEIPVTLILVAVIYIGQQIYEGIFVRDDVSNLTHILGGCVGAALGYLMNAKKKRY